MHQARLPVVAALLELLMVDRAATAPRPRLLAVRVEVGEDHKILVRVVLEEMAALGEAAQAVVALEQA